MLKNILILIYMLKQDFQKLSNQDIKTFGLDCGKWTGQNYENKIALPIRQLNLYPIKISNEFSEQSYLTNSLYKNKIN